MVTNIFITLPIIFLAADHVEDKVTYISLQIFVVKIVKAFFPPFPLKIIYNGSTKISLTPDVIFSSN